VVNLSKPDGSLQARYQYDAWGNERASSGSSWNRFAFTGHEKDEETGLYYFKARFYDPQLGRFLSQDSYLGEGDTPPSLHRYLYAYANPTVYVDLNGYESAVVQPGIGPAGLIPGITHTWWNSDPDGNGLTVGQEAFAPVIEAVEGAWSGYKYISPYHRGHNSSSGADSTYSQAESGSAYDGPAASGWNNYIEGNEGSIYGEKGGSTEARVIVEGQGITSTGGRPITDPVPHPGGFQGEEHGAWDTGHDQANVDVPQAYEHPIHQNGPTTLVYPQSDQLPTVMLNEENDANTRIIDPASLRWSQTTAGGRGRADKIRKSMAENGWTGDPIDVVETADGLATVDHTRPAVALEQGIKEIPVRVHSADERLPPDMETRRWNQAGDTATTWGEALRLRGAGQKPPIGPTGSTTPPRLPRIQGK